MEGNCQPSVWRVVVSNCESSAWRVVAANCESSAWRVIVANCEFDGPQFVSMISRYVQLALLRAEDTTHCCVPNGCLEKNEASAQSRYVKETEKEFLYGLKKLIFSGCMDCASCQGPSRKLLFFLYLFYFVFILFYFYFLYDYFSLFLI